MGPRTHPASARGIHGVSAKEGAGEEREMRGEREQREWEEGKRKLRSFHNFDYNSEVLKIGAYETAVDYLTRE